MTHTQIAIDAVRTLCTYADLLKEAREHITDKPWDDPTYLHKRISEALEMPISYPDWPYGREGEEE